MVKQFRDVDKQGALLFIHNIFYFVQAGSKVSLLLGRMPPVVGCQRIASTKKRSITLIQAVYIPAHDLIDLAPVTILANLGVTTVLFRGLAFKAFKGIHPTVDPLHSTSAMLQPRIVGNEHYESVQRAKETLQPF
ncbi:hypothetical protein ZWY2020_021694 [Hordeum vulgare]|nr:hypothetical protein ZWY2020_021694 [Hordeum vulgare]